MKCIEVQLNYIKGTLGGSILAQLNIIKYIAISLTLALSIVKNT